MDAVAPTTPAAPVVGFASVSPHVVDNAAPKRDGTSFGRAPNGPYWKCIEPGLIGSNRAPSGFPTGDTGEERGVSRLSVGIYHRLNCKRCYPCPSGPLSASMERVVAPGMDFPANGVAPMAACKSPAKSRVTVSRLIPGGRFELPVFYEKSTRFVEQE